MANPVELWKAEKHGFDVWPDLLKYAADHTPMKAIDTADLERMKWHGVFYRKRDTPGSYMLRIRLTGCELTADQAKAIAYVAYEFGYGIVDITTRANIQVQGLAIENVPAALERLTAAGLSARQTGHDNIRNVFCHPLSGVDPDELIDTRDLCRQITELFVGSRTYSDLPRKFNIAVSGHVHHGLHYWSQDVSYLATRTSSGEVLFQVLIGGTQGQNPHLGWHLPVLVEPGQAVAVTRSLLDLFRAQGSRDKRDAARFRYLIEIIGIGGVLAHLEQDLPFPLRPCVSEPSPPSGYDELIGWFPQQQPNRWTMGLSVPLGRLSWQQLEGVALASRKWGDGNLRTTHEQGIALINVPTGFRDAAATAVAAHGLSPYADTLERNTVACTGKQFCNIAVTETKGHMLQLVQKLRQRALTLHGIRIHMSGCPASCAQHHTADIGLKGVRVRRLLGTCEGFDVTLGGGIAGQVHLGIPYKLGVDIDQLPQLIEDVIKEFYLKHRPGQTFSVYWRETLRERAADKVGDGEYTPPTWLCEGCGHRHLGEDPPVYCPSCAGLRRLFARLEDGSDQAATVSNDSSDTPEARSDGFLFAARIEQVPETSGLTVEVAGKEYALFRHAGEITAIDNACPHEGGPLGQGDVANGVVTCPWHSWTFNVCTGCSLEPAGNPVQRYQTKIEGESVFIRAGGPEPQDSPDASQSIKPAAASATALPARPAKPQTATLSVREVIRESPDTLTFRLDNSQGRIPAHLPGQFLKVAVTLDGRETWRSFTISSSPTDVGTLDLTVKCNPRGEVSRFLHDTLRPGSELLVKGPSGGFYFDPARHPEPLVLISAGSGITPMMSISRALAAADATLPITMIYGARTAEDILFDAEWTALSAARPHWRRQVSLSQPGPDWQGSAGRLEFSQVPALVADVPACRYFLCGPGDFMDSFRAELLAAGVPAARIHTEQFHSSSSGAPAAAALAAGGA